MSPPVPDLMFGERRADLAQVVSRTHPGPGADDGRLPGPRVGDDPPGPDGDDTSAEIFWRAHLRTGFGVFLGEAVATASYLAVAPSSPHRAALWAMAIVWIATGAVNLALVPRVAAQPWRRARFSETWTVLSAFAVGAFAILDHGIDSPVIVLLFLPVGYAALAFTPRATAACGLSTLVVSAMVMAADPDVRLSTEDVFMLVAAFIGASVLAVAASTNRAGRERREQILLRKIVELATVDGLTGCVVHRVFHERIAQEIARSRRHGHPLSLMIVDLDEFKGVNDTYGHLVGDIVLAEAGQALRDHARARIWSAVSVETSSPYSCPTPSPKQPWHWPSASAPCSPRRSRSP